MDAIDRVMQQDQPTPKFRIGDRVRAVLPDGVDRMRHTTFEGTVTDTRAEEPYPLAKNKIVKYFVSIDDYNAEMWLEDSDVHSL